MKAFHCFSRSEHFSIYCSFTKDPSGLSTGGAEGGLRQEGPGPGGAAGGAVAGLWRNRRRIRRIRRRRQRRRFHPAGVRRRVAGPAKAAAVLHTQPGQK